MALGSTQSLTEMSTRNLPGGKGAVGRPARKAELTSIFEPTVLKMWEPQRLATHWISTVCYGDSVSFFIYIYII
jgi:hypothetical protein